MEGICIVMEYMDGGELYDRIAESRGFGEQQVCSIMKKLADAVRYCHSIDIIHRDIKV
jgi:serine/threonine protein kinase